MAIEECGRVKDLNEVLKKYSLEATVYYETAQWAGDGTERAIRAGLG
ncbi:MAG: hypothetical protein ACM34E_00380 [Acidobacteriota bacterium]